MAILALIVTSSIVLIHFLLGQKPKEITPKKYDTYECGVPYEQDAKQQFSIRYYLIAIIFLIFDVEVVFMYPWIITFKNYIAKGPFILLEVALFILLLLGGYFYLRMRNALDWE
jgi:NADH-quinone oxidoreductase subunit A